MPPNILLIVLDDIGVEKLGLYDLAASTPATPSFDALAKEGVLFTRAYGGPVCGPTRAALQTGRYAFRTGFGTNIADADGPDGYRLPDSEVLLGEMLRRAGYQTGAFGKWHLTRGTGDDLHPNRNGYQHFAGCMSNTLGAGNGTGHYDWRRVVDGASGFVTAPPFDTTQWQASVTKHDALSWIRNRTGKWFAYVAFNPPHSPYAVPPAALLSDDMLAKLDAQGLAPGDVAGVQDTLARRLLVYDACIEAVDAELGDLVKQVVTPDTLVIVMGDNGTPGDVIQPPYVAQHAKRSLYEQGIRLPFLVAGAGIEAPGRTSNALVHAVDVWRTLFALTVGGGPVLGGSSDGRDGISFLPVLLDPNLPGPRTRIFTQSFKPNGFGPYFVELRVYHDGQYKLLNVAGREEFYRIEVDPRELNDLIISGMTRPEQLRLATLRAEMHALLAS